MIGLHHGEPGRQIFREIRIKAAVEARGKGLILKKGMLMQQQDTLEEVFLRATSEDDAAATNGR